MEAYARGIVLTRLEVVAESESDARGLLGVTDDAGKPIPPSPCAVQLRVRIAATNVAAAVLRELIEHSHCCSPVSAAVEGSVPVSLCIDMEPD